MHFNHTRAARLGGWAKKKGGGSASKLCMHIPCTRYKWKPHFLFYPEYARIYEIRTEDLGDSNKYLGADLQIYFSLLYYRTTMPSDAAKKRQAQKREKKQASSRAAQKKVNATATDSPLPSASGEGPSSSSGACALTSTVTNGIAGMKLSNRSCTGE